MWFVRGRWCRLGLAVAAISAVWACVGVLTTMQLFLVLNFSVLVLHHFKEYSAVRLGLCCLLAVTACSPQGGRAITTAGVSRMPGATVIEHVSVIPMDRRGVLHDHSVVISGDRIVSVAPANQVTPAPTSRRIDGRGKFLVPGLADMHAHTIEAADLELYAAVGVTQLRILAATPIAIALRDETPDGSVLRPSMYVEGLLTDGDPPIWPFSRIVVTPADAARNRTWKPRITPHG